MKIFGRRAIEALRVQCVNGLDLARRERDGIAVLLLAALLLLAVPEWTRRWQAAKYESWWVGLPANTQRWLDSLHQEYRVADTLFVFDPNKIGAEDWMRLGMAASLARRVERYVQAGGRFREPTDLLRVYGFPEDEYERLASWVAIEAEGEGRGSRGWGGAQSKGSSGGWGGGESRGSSGGWGGGESRGSSGGWGGGWSGAGAGRGSEGASGFAVTSRGYDGPPIDLRHAGVGDLDQLPGIGPGLAGRIVRYRSRLGGFYSADQVGEVYGLDTAVYRQIRPHLICSAGPLKQLFINISPLDSLKKHPYLPPWVAADIVTYRNKHEGFVSLDELRSIRSLKDSLHQKVLPYLELGAWSAD